MEKREKKFLILSIIGNLILLLFLAKIFNTSRSEKREQSLAIPVELQAVTKKSLPVLEKPKVIIYNRVGKCGSSYGSHSLPL